MAALPRPARPEDRGDRFRAQPSGRQLRVNVELQDDFSLHQALSLYLIDTLPAARPRVARLSVRRAHALRSDRRGSRPDSAPAGRQTEGPEDRGMESRRHPLRGAHGQTGGDRASEAAARISLRHVQRLRRRPSVGRTGKRPAQVDRARNVRALPVVRRLRARLRPRAQRGPAAAPSHAGLEGARAKPCPIPRRRPRSSKWRTTFAN